MIKSSLNRRQLLQAGAAGAAAISAPYVFAQAPM
ncbi:MAG: twin-arginine translocation signal domain-containing protein, partial [Burkholderiaceae bacterium]